LNNKVEQVIRRRIRRDAEEELGGMEHEVSSVVVIKEPEQMDIEQVAH